jgi:hypothetical protein
VIGTRRVRRSINPMKRYLAILAALLITAPAAGPVVADVLPRIVLLYTSKTQPPVEEVKQILVEHFEELDMTVALSVREIERLPRTRREWYLNADKASSAPGTLAVFGYRCERRHCRLYIVVSHKRSFVEIPVRPRQKSDQNLSVASTIREALLGPLMPELDRLVKEGRKPKKPVSPDKAWARPPYEKERRASAVQRRPWLWLEGGYHGDHPHPKGQPIHGPWMGVEMEPTPIAGVSVSLGWLGVRRAEAEGGQIRIHRLTPAVAVRLIVPVGPARLALAPVARLDAAFYQFDHVGQDDTRETRFELQVGGMATWHLPMIPRLCAVVGAGVLVSVINEQAEVVGSAGQTETAIPASVVRLAWTIGIAWSPIR